MLCIRCGYDLRSGKKIKTQVEMGPSRVGAKAGGKAVKSDDDFAHLVVPPLMLVLSVGIIIVSFLSRNMLSAETKTPEQIEAIQDAQAYLSQRSYNDTLYKEYSSERPKQTLILPRDLSKPAPLLVILGSDQLPAESLIKIAASDCAIFRIEAPGGDGDRVWSENWEEDAFIVSKELQKMLAQKKFKAGPVIIAGIGQGGAAAIEIAARDPDNYLYVIAADPKSMRPMLDDVDTHDQKKQKYVLLQSPSDETNKSKDSYRLSLEADLGLNVPDTHLERPADAAVILETALKISSRK